MQSPRLVCEKCGHKWVARVEEPLKCPKCGHIRGASVRNKVAGPATNQNPAALGPSTHWEVKWAL